MARRASVKDGCACRVVQAIYLQIIRFLERKKFDFIDLADDDEHAEIRAR